MVITAPALGGDKGRGSSPPLHMQQLCVGGKLTCLAVLLQPVLLPNRGKGAANALMLYRENCLLAEEAPPFFFLGEWIKFVSCKLTPSHMCRVNPSPPLVTVSALGGE